LSVSPTLIQIYCTVLYCPPFCSVVLFMPPPQHLAYFLDVIFSSDTALLLV
jgi:hypothetical protein